MDRAGARKIFLRDLQTSSAARSDNFVYISHLDYEESMSAAQKLARLIPQPQGQQSEDMVHISSFARVRNRNEILLVKKNKPDFTAGKWVFPSAIINFGEDPAMAVERIVKEQLGTAPKNVKLIDVQSYGDKHWDLCFVYDVTIDRVGKLSADIDTAGYFDRKKLPPEFRSDHLEVLNGLDKAKEFARPWP